MEIVDEKLDSHNLRDFLRIKQEDHQNNFNQSTSSGSGGGGRSNCENPTGLTLYAVLCEKRGPPETAAARDEPLRRIESNRTLLDIIREDQTSGLGEVRRRDAGRRWRHLRDKIRFRHRGSESDWSSTVTIPTSDVPLHHHLRMTMMTRRHSSRFNSIPDSTESTQSDVSTAEIRVPRRRLIDEDNRHENEELEERIAETVESYDEAAERDGTAEQPARMSLMALLAETDRQMGLEGSSYIMVENEEEDFSGGATTPAAAHGGEYNNCCVCMVRHKGSAFIPCGHTFCRLCSRELWVQRGHCPLCNNYILEILDIF